MSKFHYKRNPFRQKGKLPCLHIHEKNELKVKWAIRIITVVGIATSIFTLHWTASLILSIVLTSISLYLEKTTYYYTSMYIQSLPNFKYDSSKWLSMLYCVLDKQTSESKKGHLNIVGLVFNDEIYAKNMFELFKSWNHGSCDDCENNIKLSFIIDEDKYYVYIYPSLEKRRIKQFHEDTEEENKLNKYGKEHFGLIVQLIICKHFSTLYGYGLEVFIDNQDFDKPFLIAPFINTDKGNPIPLFNIEPIRLYHYKAKNKYELTDDDFEFIHINHIIKR
jgi:hypothetical protein